MKKVLFGIILTLLLAFSSTAVFADETTTGTTTTNGFEDPGNGTGTGGH